MRFAELGGSSTSKIVFSFSQLPPKLGVSQVKSEPWAEAMGPASGGIPPMRPPALGREPLHGSSP